MSTIVSIWQSYLCNVLSIIKIIGCPDLLLLPEELGLDDGEQYGFTGRLAKVVGANQLQGVGAGNDLASFAIAPGRKTQVINVGSNLTTAEHYYVHVIGKGKDQECGSGGSCPSFTDPGFTAPYDSRPNLLVPLPDEDLTWLTYHVYRGLLADDTLTEKPNKPLPAYSWAYRPEYQFSQFGLEMQSITATKTDGNGVETSTNILDSDSPIIDSGDYITALYSLISSNHDRLTAIDGPQELILAIGAEEQIITIGADNSITFSNLAHLTQLSDIDFLTMRLYANNDASNVLWEWAFSTVEIDIDSDNDNGFELPDRSREEEEIESLIDFTGKIMALNHGDVNENNIPDFAEFDYGNFDSEEDEPQFTRVIIEVPKGIDLEITKIRFHYSGSNPTKTTKKTDPDTEKEYYTPDKGDLRLWTKNANKKRSPESYTKVDGEGDYIVPERYYRLTDLGFTDAERTKTLYIEAILPSKEIGDAIIKVELN
jgi:hypothetical protein